MAGALPPGGFDPFRESIARLFPDEPGDGEVSPTERQNYNTFAKSTGLATEEELRETSDESILIANLRQAGVDVDHPTVQAFITEYPDMLNDPTLGPAAMINLKEQFPAVPEQSYDLALAQSGFKGAFAPSLDPAGMAAITSGSDTQVAQFRKQNPNYEENPDTGWIRYQNGVLVSPDKDVLYDPTSKAPGSLAWQREVVSGWSSEQVSTWADRLVKFGYLTKEQAKKASSNDPGFLGALSAYHSNRYAYGRAVTGEFAGVGAAGATEKPPLVNFEDMSAQIRNDVREQYRRVMGMDPTDGQTQAWTDYIIRTGMGLQKKYRRKEYGGYQSMAATEAEERFIERLEGSPQATFLRESEEENTSLRDALQQAVIVTNSLGG